MKTRYLFNEHSAVRRKVAFPSHTPNGRATRRPYRVWRPWHMSEAVERIHAKRARVAARASVVARAGRQVLQ